MSDKSFPMCVCSDYWDGHHSNCTVLRRMKKDRAEIERLETIELAYIGQSGVLSELTEKIERLEAENARLERHISGLLIQNGEMAAEAIKEKSDD